MYINLCLCVTIGCYGSFEYTNHKILSINKIKISNNLHDAQNIPKCHNYLVTYNSLQV
jgi:hypothetical protein